MAGILEVKTKRNALHYIVTIQKQFASDLFFFSQTGITFKCV